MEEAGINISLLFALSHLLAAGFVFFMGGLVLVRDPNNSLNRIFFLFCLSVAYWGFIDFQFLTAPDSSLAFLWMKIGAFWPLAVAFLFHFTLMFAGIRLLSSRLAYLLIYGPAVLNAVLWLLPGIMLGRPEQEYWGWDFEPHLTLAGDLSMMAVGLQALAVPLILIDLRRREKNPTKKREIKLVLAGFSIPVFAALVEAAVSSILDISLPDFTIISTALGIGGFIGYAMWKMEMFPLTPAKAAEDIISHISDYLFLIDQEGKIVTANQPALKALGYFKGELAGRQLNLVMPEERRSDSSTCAGSDVASTVLKTKTGASIPVSVSCSAISSKKGEMQGAVLVASDLKGSGQAQSLLRESEERFRSLIDAIPEVIYSLDKKGNISALNPAFEKITGWKRSEWLGKSFQMLVHPDDLPQALGAFKRILTGETPPPRELRILSRPGKYLIGEFVSSPIIHDGQITGESGIARDITARKENERKVLQHADDLALINLLNEGANQGHGLSYLINLLSTELKRMFSCHASIVYLPSPDKRFLTLHKSSTSSNGASKVEKITRFSLSKMDIKIPLRKSGFYYQLLANGKPRLISDPEDIQAMIADFSESKVVKKLAAPIYHLLESKSVIAVPFVSRGEVIGLLELSKKEPFADEDLQRVTVVSGQVTSILERRRAEKERQVNINKLNKAESGFIHAISLMVESRDLYTAGHQQRVAELARKIAMEMHLAGDQIEGIYTAGYIHDLGKIHVPAEILTKPGQLSQIEMSIVKTHPQVGFDILKELEFPWPIARIVHEHHERWDGSGYPRGLQADEICLEARVLCVADVVEAMSSHRPYRPMLGTDAAVNEISNNQGTLYDPQVSGACIRLIRQEGFSIETSLTQRSKSGL